MKLSDSGSSMLRVITGSAKNKRLLVPANVTRPITDRIKTSLFDIIKDLVPRSRVLDLFAGSGALGIEALSRGASSAVFVDNNPQAIKIINKNLNNCGLLDNTGRYLQDVTEFLSSQSNRGQFQIIFLDPPFSLPQDQKLELADLCSRVLEISGLLVLRYPEKENYPHIYKNLEKKFTKLYGISEVSFYQKQ